MIKYIVLKEIADQIIKLRFLLTASATVLLFFITTLAFRAEYQSTVEGYKKPEQLAESVITSKNYQLAFFVQRSIEVDQAPQAIRFCVNAGTDLLPNQFFVGSFWNQEVKASFNKPNENPWIQKISTIDWIFLVSMLLSFMAFVLSYDAISGEKEDGTLRLMLSNSIGRFQFLVAKFIGILVILLMPLFIGQLLSLLLISATSFIHLSMLDWIRIGIIIILSWIFLATCVWLGLLISSITPRSSTNLVILLFIWVLFVIVIPNCGSSLAKIFYDLPRKEEIYNRTERILDAAYKEMKDKDGIVQAKKQVAALKLGAKIRADYRQQKFLQANLARLFGRLSPISVFEYAAESSAAVGLTYHRHFLEQLIMYRHQLDDFILSEEKRLSDDPKGLITYKTLPWKTFNGNNFPVFREQPIKILQGLRDGLVELTILIFYGILFCTGAFVAFLKFDVS